MRNSDVEKWLRLWAHKPDSNIWKYVAISDLSNDFIREFKDNFSWNRYTLTYLEKNRPELYLELFKLE